MEGRMRPIRDTLHESVFHRIEVDVVDVALIVAFVANAMFPIAALPEAALGFVQATWRASFAGCDAPRKAGFDQPPTGRKIVIPRRQLPQAMQVIRQHDQRGHGEGMVLVRRAKRFSQCIARGSHRCIASAFGQVDGEEIQTASRAIANVRAHAAKRDCNHASPPSEKSAICVGWVGFINPAIDPASGWVGEANPAYGFDLDGSVGITVMPRRLGWLHQPSY